MSFGGFSQEPELFDNEWFLTEITQDGEEISIPDNDEVSFVPLTFGKPGNDTIRNFSTDVCNYLSADVEYSAEENTFVLVLPVSSLIVCNNFDNQEFELAYFGFYEEEGAFDYDISEENETKTLTITSPDGTDTATYTSTNLSTASEVVKKLRLYPNPTSDKLFLPKGFEGKNIAVLFYEREKSHRF